MTPPVARYMIVCEDWRFSVTNADRVDIFGLLTSIHPQEEEPFPVLVRELCVFLLLTNIRGSGSIRLVCVFEDTGEWVFATPAHEFSFSNDPLMVLGVPFRVRDCPFPRAGLYAIQFWYNDIMVAQQNVLLR